MADAKTRGFRWLPSYYEAIRDLPDEARLAVYDAICDFGFGQTPAELQGIASCVFKLICPSLEKSVMFFEKQAKNGAKGGRPKDSAKPKQNPNETQMKPKRKRDSDSEIESESENESESESELFISADKPRTSKRFVPPSREEAEGYAREIGFANFDADHFIDYYATRGWKLANGVCMKDWRAAVRNWKRRDDSQNKGFVYDPGDTSRSL